MRPCVCVCVCVCVVPIRLSGAGFVDMAKARIDGVVFSGTEPALCLAGSLDPGVLRRGYCMESCFSAPLGLNVLSGPAQRVSSASAFPPSLSRSLVYTQRRLSRTRAAPCCAAPSRDPSASVLLLSRYAADAK